MTLSGGRCRGTLRSQDEAKECLQLSLESEKGRCSSDGRRQTVARPWSGDIERPVSESGSTNRRDDDSRRAEVTTAVDVSRMTDAVREVRLGRAVQTTLRQNTEAEAYPLWNSQPVEVVDERRDVSRCHQQTTTL